MTRKFASITPDILVRKGDAAPSLTAAVREPLGPIALHARLRPVEKPALANSGGSAETRESDAEQRRFFYAPGTPDSAAGDGKGGSDAPAGETASVGSDAHSARILSCLRTATRGSSGWPRFRLASTARK